MRKGFSLVEIMAVVAVAGIVAAAGISSMVPILERSRREDQARSALAQVRKVRARALTANEGAAIEAEPLPGGGVRLTTASVPRVGGLPQCQNYDTRASFIEARVYDLVDIVVPRADNTLCFEASAFRLLDADGVTLAPAPATIDFFEAGTPDGVGAVTVAPTGALGSTFEPAVEEGLSATVNIATIPPLEDPVRNVVEPRALEAELPVTETPPPDPTTPAGQPTVDPLPLPTGDPPPPPPPACTINADCLPGFMCSANLCVPTNCANSTDCAPGFYCDIGFGTCNLGTGCSSDADCSPNETCNAGFCEYGCNTVTCPQFPACSGGPSMCQHNGCCGVYGCPCI